LSSILAAFSFIFVVNTGSPVSTFVDAAGLPTKRSVAFPIWFYIQKLSCNFITKWAFWQWGRRAYFPFLAAFQQSLYICLWKSAISFDLMIMAIFSRQEVMRTLSS